MANRRADLFLMWMRVVEMYTLARAAKGLTQDELDFEPHPGCMERPAPGRAPHQARGR